MPRRIYSFAISTLLCTILLGTVSSPQAEAQEVSQRVRVSQNYGETFTGQVTERSDSSLVILDQASGQYYSISYADIQALSVSQGMRSNAKMGLIGGGVIGGLLGSSVCASACDGGTKGLFVAVGAVGMGLVGGVVGSLMEYEEWTTIPIPRQTTLRFEPLLGVGLAARPVFGVRLKL